MTYITVISPLTLASLLLAPSFLARIELSAPAAPAQASEQARNPYLGTWQRQVSDATGTTKITLEIKANGSYTKTLDAVLRGHAFHGVEQGTWTAQGPVVQLSGDGRFPPSRHDLRNYQKIH